MRTGLVMGWVGGRGALGWGGPLLLPFGHQGPTVLFVVFEAYIPRWHLRVRISL